MVKGKVLIAGAVLLSATLVKIGVAQDTTKFNSKEPKTESIAGTDSLRTVFGRADSVARVIFDEYYATRRKERQAGTDTSSANSTLSADNAVIDSSQTELTARRDEIALIYKEFADGLKDIGTLSTEEIGRLKAKLNLIKTEACLVSLDLEGLANIMKRLDGAETQIKRNAEIEAGRLHQHELVALDSSLAALKNQVRGMQYSQIDSVNALLGSASLQVNAKGETKQKHEIANISKLYGQRKADLEWKEGKRKQEAKKQADLDYVDSELARLDRLTAAMKAQGLYEYIGEIRAIYDSLEAQLTMRKATKQQTKGFARSKSDFELAVKDLEVKKQEILRLGAINTSLDSAEAGVRGLQLSNVDAVDLLVKKAKEDACTGSEEQKQRALQLEEALFQRLDTLVQQSFSDNLANVESSIATMTWENKDSVKAALDTLGKRIDRIGNADNKSKHAQVSKEYQEVLNALEEAKKEEEKKNQFESTFKKF